MILDLDLPTYHHYLFYHEDRNPFDWLSWLGIGGAFISPLPHKASATLDNHTPSCMWTLLLAKAKSGQLNGCKKMKSKQLSNISHCW